MNTHYTNIEVQTLNQEGFGVSSKNITMLQHADFVMVDEASMVGPEKLRNIDFVFRRARNYLSTPFGGLHICLSADDLQLGEVGATHPRYRPLNAPEYFEQVKRTSKTNTDDFLPLVHDPDSDEETDPDRYAIPTNMPPPKEGYVYRWRATPSQIKGYKLWRKFDSTVMFRQTMRFRDPQWKEGMAKARKGEWTEEFISLINSRHLPSAASYNLFDEDQSEIGKYAKTQHYDTLFHAFRDKSYIPVISPLNVTKQAVIHDHTKACAAAMPAYHYPIRIIGTFAIVVPRDEKNLKHKDVTLETKLTKKDIEYLMSLSENNLDRFSPFIDIHPGLNVYITQNVCKFDGVVNAAFATIHDIVFPPNTQFKLFADTTLSINVLVPDKQPSYILVKLDHDLPPNTFPGLPPNVFPIFRKYSNGKIIDLPSNPDTPNKKRSAKIKITQFPLVSAVASSIYKIQGDTLEAGIIGQWRSSTAADHPHQAYVQISRFPTPENFTIMYPFTQEDAAYFKPKQDALDEEERLIKLAEKYTADFKRKYYPPPPP
jgi:hypothetical protein